MPLIRIQHRTDLFSREQKQQLAERLTQLLLDVEGGHDTPAGRTLAYVVFVDVPGDQWFVGGRSDTTYQIGNERILVDVTVPEASTSQSHKTRIHRAINAALAEVLGWLPDTPQMNAWVIVHEVAEGHWGANGSTFGLAQIAVFAGAATDTDTDTGTGTGANVPADLERNTFVKSYFKAKASAYQSAGYPVDVSGLYRAAKKSK
jgi:phenylpyruvate tautomerase PptA (4-oxalocrotonate tautomerase family)